jgi:hypothetical protein
VREPSTRLLADGISKSSVAARLGYSGTKALGALRADGSSHDSRLGGLVCD